MVEIKSKKRSFGKRGFSSPLKYSFSTPATEFISCSFWSSISGSSPNEEETHSSMLGVVDRIQKCVSDVTLASLEWVLNVVDLHLRSWHAENALLLQPWEKNQAMLQQPSKKPQKHIVWNRRFRLIIKGAAFSSRRRLFIKAAAACGFTYRTLINFHWIQNKDLQAIAEAIREGLGGWLDYSWTMLVFRDPPEKQSWVGQTPNSGLFVEIKFLNDLQLTQLGLKYGVKFLSKLSNERISNSTHTRNVPQVQDSLHAHSWNFFSTFVGIFLRS